MDDLITAARAHWKQFIWIWAFPFVMVFIFSPIEKWLPEYRWPLFFFIELPVFFISGWRGRAPLREKTVTTGQGVVLTMVAPVVLLLSALALHDALMLFVE